MQGFTATTRVRQVVAETAFLLPEPATTCIAPRPACSLGRSNWSNRRRFLYWIEGPKAFLTSQLPPGSFLVFVLSMFSSCWTMREGVVAGLSSAKSLEDGGTGDFKGRRFPTVEVY